LAANFYLYFLSTLVSQLGSVNVNVSINSNNPLLPYFDLTLARLLEHSSDGVALAVPYPSWHLVFVNPTLARWLGSRPGNGTGTPMAEILGTEHVGALLERLDRAWRGDVDSGAFLARLGAANGRGGGPPVELWFSRIDLVGKACVGIVIRPADPQKRITADRRDPLTGLADRSHLMARLDMLLGGDRMADQRFAVLFIDLDGFKRVNDRLGHLVGDQVLGEAARRLAQCTRANDLVARYGGDEFVVLVEEAGSWEEFEPVVERIQAALAEPFETPAGSVRLSASVGVAESSAECQTPVDVLAAADRAMYAAKRRVFQRAAT
jgi:diguanylate cyclase (GGDEF)-like protein